jgi:hypothetical protein
MLQLMQLIFVVYQEMSSKLYYDSTLSSETLHKSVTK